MADEKYNLTYTGEQVESLLGQISNVASRIPSRVSQLTNDAGYITGSSLPTKTSQLTNDSGFITSSAVPTKVSDLTNDANYATATSVTAEVTRATGVEAGLRADVDAIAAKIPLNASASNQLADKAFVNSSIQSSTASLITNNGNPFGSVAQLRQVTANEGDYAYVTVAASGGTYYDRYKYTNGQWVLEYRVNSTVFTAAQWAAINSNITAALTQKVTTLPDAYTAITTAEINTICV